MTTPRIGLLPAGAHGFDANSVVSDVSARRFRQAGFTFAVRYVRRGPSNAHDVSTGEILTLLRAGLAVMLVQHVALPGWTPSVALGASYGTVAATESRLVGYPLGGTVWCDLEGVKRGVPEEDVIAYCNAWFRAVAAEGYTPGLYVGDSAGISAKALYARLLFEHYWSAYNLNRDDFPAVRGVQMRQKPYPPESQRVPCPFEYDVDVVEEDAKGGLPIALLPV